MSFAELKGFLAFKAGKSEKDCPYLRFSQKWHDWREGWLEAYCQRIQELKAHGVRIL